MPITIKRTPPPGVREFHTPEDFRDQTFFDAFADVFTPPEDLPLHRPDCGFLARVRDAQRIHEDFNKAIVKAGFDPEDNEAKSKRHYKTLVISRKRENDDSDKSLVVAHQKKTKGPGRLFMIHSKEKNKGTNKVFVISAKAK